MTATEKLLPAREVYSRIGKGRETVRKLCVSGSFPQPIRTSPSGPKYWLCSEVDAWVSDRIHEARSAAKVAP